MDIIRQFRVKWWNAFNSEPVQTPAVRLWLQKQGFQKPDPSATLFLAQRSFANSQLMSAKTEEEYFALMKQLLDSRISSKASAASSSASPPLMDFGDDDEDICYEISDPLL